MYLSLITKLFALLSTVQYLIGVREGRGEEEEGGRETHKIWAGFKIFYGIPFIASDGAHVSPLRFIVRLVSRCKKVGHHCFWINLYIKSYGN